MKIFLLDLWQDLRAKRLWPVAAVLAVALVAVPLVLSKSSEAPPPAAAPAESARTAPDPKDLKALATVKLDEDAMERGSTLNTFDPSDPFRPPKAIAKRSRPDSGSPSTVTSEAPAAGDATGSAGSGDTGSTGGGSVPSTGGGDTGSTGGGGTGGGGTTTAPQYRYMVDATFSVNGHKRHFKGLERLDMLPNEASPLLLFLGVTEGAGNAVFLVDSSLDAEGEGKCKPKPSKCAFLYIGAGSEHQFTNAEGDSYTLRIGEIRKVRVDGASAAASAVMAAPATPAATVPAPTVSRVQPMRVGVGDLLTITGEHFNARRSRNTVIFRSPDGRIAFAKPQRATTRKLVLRIPAGATRLLRVSDGQPLATRLKLRVLTRKFSKSTSQRLSPVVTASVSQAAADGRLELGGPLPSQ
jgi:hypothetical protein